MNKISSLGATFLGEQGTEFLVFAPFADQIELHVKGLQEENFFMTREALGYHHYLAAEVVPGNLYQFHFNQQDYPDPASRYQPNGVWGPSEVVNSAYPWTDSAWQGLILANYIVYELHVGTYTQEGTLAAIIPTLDRLCELGITAIELMPVSQFPGERNWGYDGVFPFAVQNSYGTPYQLKELINACHQRGLAVVLDVVYNHLGPEGNVLPAFGPYFTNRYRTPWGSAINFDGPYSDEVRRYFLENALMWVQEYHIDALRLDALHAVFDYSAYPFLTELSDKIHAFAKQVSRHIYLIAESDLNDTKFIRPKELGGYGLDAQWNDDFHHVSHTLLTEERHGYYQDFGKFEQLSKAFSEGYVYSGQYSLYRKRRHGHYSRVIPAEKFVVFTQNHDQIGNRLLGERLTQLVNFSQLKLAAGLLLLAPFVPLLFMGEEYAEDAPFYYFTSHTDPKLIAAVQEGRQAEHAWHGLGEIPDPQALNTFIRSKLNPNLRTIGHHQILNRFYQELIRLRKTIPALKQLNKDNLIVEQKTEQEVLMIHRWHEDDEVLIFLHLSNLTQEVKLPIPSGKWEKQLDAAAEQWDGEGDLLPDKIVVKQPMTIKLGPYALGVYRLVTRI